MRRLPSLNGLRAFEAAARLGSFVAAGAELNVTQAAVSRMVRLLEARLGFALFERLPNGLALTVQGKALQPNLTAAFDAIAAITEQVAAMPTTPVLTLGVGPSFASDLLTWVAFLAISAVALYSVFNQLRDVLAGLLAAL